MPFPQPSQPYGNLIDQFNRLEARLQDRADEDGYDEQLTQDEWGLLCRTLADHGFHALEHALAYGDTPIGPSVLRALSTELRRLQKIEDKPPARWQHECPKLKEGESALCRHREARYDWTQYEMLPETDTWKFQRIKQYRDRGDFVEFWSEPFENPEVTAEMMPPQPLIDVDEVFLSAGDEEIEEEMSTHDPEDSEDEETEIE